MNSYLALVSKYTKVHKRKNRLTVICIAISVMLVTAIFGMADMSIRAQINAYIKQSGNVHAILNGITGSVADQIGKRSDVKVSDWVGAVEDTRYREKVLIVQGGGQELAGQMNLVVQEGRYPESEQEALLDKQAMKQFGISIGDDIEVEFDGGQSRRYKITGIYGDFSALTGKDAHGLFLTAEGVRGIGSEHYVESYYVQFEKGTDIQRSLDEIKLEYGLSDQQISPNITLLGLMGQGDDSAVRQLYLTAAILFLLVTMSGVFMIAGSFNRSIIERTQFFGLLRCLGASKKQLKRYIRLEGLQYSLKGIPIGLSAGCLVMWGAVFILNALDLRFLLPEMPLFQISWTGIGAGAIIGFLVVMIASGAPAKKAAQVSPQAAVTGNGNQAAAHRIRKSTNTKLRVDTALGFHHAYSNKKNLLLTSGSFALSIVLLLSFTVLIDFMNHAANPLKPYAPDITVSGADRVSKIERPVVENMKKLPHIKQIYGRMLCWDIPAEGRGERGTATLVSYDTTQLHWAEDMLSAGKIKNVQDGNGVLVGYDKREKSRWKTGDIITLEISGESCNLEIAGILSDMPVDASGSEWVFVCSEATFTGITGIVDYTVLDMQVEQDISEQVRELMPPDMQLFDSQQRNQETRTAYYTMAIFVYGFVSVIALVAFIHILNTVDAGVSGRMGHYGIMRALGMSIRQLKRMVLAEAAWYAGIGCMTGSVFGILLNRFLFTIMVTSNWGAVWKPPFTVLGITVLSAILTTFTAVISPMGRIKKMNIVHVVNGE